MIRPASSQLQKAVEMPAQRGEKKILPRTFSLKEKRHLLSNDRKILRYSGGGGGGISPVSSVASLPTDVRNVRVEDLERRATSMAQGTGGFMGSNDENREGRIWGNKVVLPVR